MQLVDGVPLVFHNLNYSLLDLVSDDFVVLTKNVGILFQSLTQPKQPCLTQMVVIR